MWTGHGSRAAASYPKSAHTADELREPASRMLLRADGDGGRGTGLEP